MIEVLRTADRIKLSAAVAVLQEAGVAAETFDLAAGSMWGTAIPVRLMVEDAEVAAARAALRAAGWREASDGDWDL